jgi:hypothetical protein
MSSDNERGSVLKGVIRSTPEGVTAVGAFGLLVSLGSNPAAWSVLGIGLVLWFGKGMIGCRHSAEKYPVKPAAAEVVRGVAANRPGHSPPAAFRRPMQHRA